jgi:multidrug efflux system outer membrane protein
MRRLPRQFAATLTALAAAVLAGCAAVGPDFQAPEARTPDHFNDPARPAASAASSATETAEPDPRWWRAFQDPVLDSLIERAVAGNLNLQQAVWRIAQARAQTQVARAAGLPDVRATASYNRQQLGLEGLLRTNGVYDRVNALGPQYAGPAGTALNEITQPVNLFQLGFDASWELDLFGRVRRSVEASEAQTQAAIESRNDALVSLEAEVAQTYAQLRGAQALLRLSVEQTALERDTLWLTTNRREHGLASDLDVQNAQAQLAALEADTPQFEQQAQQAMNALAVLTGEPPGALDAELGTPRAFETLPVSVPVGLPASLARRRPDVRQAEATLHAATAGIGVATAQLFPDVSLTGQFGWRSTRAGDVTRWASHFYSLSPGVSLPIFQGGALVSNIRLAKAQQAEAALAYRQAVLTALADVENALVVYRTDQVRRAAFGRTVDASRRAFELASDSYRNGLVDFLNVLNAQRQYTQSRQQLTQAALQLNTDLVALYKALGGGWQDASGDVAVGTLGNAGERVAAGPGTGQATGQALGAQR